MSSHSMPRALVVLIVAFIASVALTACSSGSSKSSSTTVPTSTTPASTSATTTTSTSATATTTAPSAADDLERFFAAAANEDRLLKAAATAVNAAIGTTQITIEKSTLDAIEAANPTPVAAEIPPGLTDSVMLPVLTVQSDLVSRYYSLRGLRIYLANTGEPTTVPITAPQVRYVLACLGEGAPAAASFATDVTAARAAATGAPRVAAVDPSSRAAAELAVRLARSVLWNSGGAGCGGARVTSLVPITWSATPPVRGGTAAWKGDVAGVAFDANFAAGRGWTVEIHAN